jgi:hypothetical protein
VTSMTTATVRGIGCVDTHGHSHHPAVIDGVGRQLDDREFPASPAGYAALLEWLRGHGEVIEWVSRAPVPPVSRSLDISARVLALDVADAEAVFAQAVAAGAAIRQPLADIF